MRGSALDKALFPQQEEAKVLLVDPDDAGGEEGLLADLVSLLGEASFAPTASLSMSIPPGVLGDVHLMQPVSRKDSLRGGGVPTQSVLNPTAVLAAHPTVQAALWS